jgi:protein TonB
VNGKSSSGSDSGAINTALKGNAPFTSAAPDYLHNPPPEYPQEARLNHQQGVVLLLVDVSQDGTVLTVSLQRSSGYRRLDEAALRAAKEWKFKPATAGGQTVHSKVEVPVRFRLQ